MSLARFAPLNGLPRTRESTPRKFSFAVVGLSNRSRVKVVALVAEYAETRALSPGYAKSVAGRLVPMHTTYSLRDRKCDPGF